MTNNSIKKVQLKAKSYRMNEKTYTKWSYKSRNILLSQVKYDNYTLYMYVCMWRKGKRKIKQIANGKNEAKKYVDEADDEQELSKVWNFV